HTAPSSSHTLTHSTFIITHTYTQHLHHTHLHTAPSSSHTLTHRHTHTHTRTHRHTHRHTTTHTHTHTQTEASVLFPKVKAFSPQLDVLESKSVLKSVFQSQASPPLSSPPLSHCPSV